MLSHQRCRDPWRFGYEMGASSGLTTLASYLLQNTTSLSTKAHSGMQCISDMVVSLHLPSHCTRVVSFSVDHGFSCPYSALPSIRLNDFRDLTTKLLTEVCPSLATEPTLQPFTWDLLSFRTSNSEEGPHFDVSTQSVLYFTSKNAR